MIQRQSELLRPGEVAKIFGVNPKTVTHWANNGKLPYIITPGGHRRYRRDAVMAYMTLGTQRKIRD